MTILINIRCLPFAFFICQSTLGFPTDLIFKSLRQYIAYLQEIVCFSLKTNSSRITMRDARLYTNVLELYRQCINMGIEQYFLIKKVLYYLSETFKPRSHIKEAQPIWERNLFGFLFL
jgi:hypothetical protein